MCVLMLSTQTSSTSVQILVFDLFQSDALEIEPVPRNKVPPVWILKSQCAVYYVLT